MNYSMNDMEHSVDRRQVLKLGAGAAAAATAVALVPTGSASAAPSAPSRAVPAQTKKSIGTAGFERLWGASFKTQTQIVNGKRKRVRVKVLRTRAVWEGTDTKTLDKGGLCHWLGTAPPLANGNCVLFGHRTKARGLLRNVHRVKSNDRFVLSINGQSKTYSVVQPKVIIGSKDFAQAINWGDKNKSYITLVACTKPNGMPSSTKHRFLVRLVEV
jgi:LPXTG-site transpeptidase (sortase) family protein